MKNKFLVFLMIFFSISLQIFPSFATEIDNVPVWSDTSDLVIQTSNEPTFDIASQAGILIELTTGKVLYDKNSHEQLRPASVTKVMTILLIMEALDSGKIGLGDRVPCSENAASMGGSQIWLDSRETLTVDEMLKAICIVSANDRKCCNGRTYSW